MTSSHLDWPFLEPRHKTLATELDHWADRMLSDELQPILLAQWMMLAANLCASLARVAG